MKKLFYVPLALFVAVMLPSCNGKSAKAGGKFIKQAYKEYKMMNDSEGIRYLKMKHRMNQLEDVINKYNICSNCGGYGVVYCVDENGYYYTDSYGNPQLYTCDKCGGDGKAL